MSATRCLLSRVHELLGLRGVISWRPRSSSRLFTVESIQPKQRASSTASGYGHAGRPVGFFHEQSHTPRSDAWFSASQARQAARLSAWKTGRSNFHVAGCSDADAGTLLIAVVRFRRSEAGGEHDLDEGGAVGGEGPLEGGGELLGGGGPLGGDAQALGQGAEVDVGPAEVEHRQRRGPRLLGADPLTAPC